MMPKDTLRALHNKYQGRRGFIIATGPSLAFRHLDFLKDEITIALNLAPLMFDQWGFQPTFHMVADRYIYPQHPEVFKKLTYGKEINKLVVARATQSVPEELLDQHTALIPKFFPDDQKGFSEDPVRDGFYRGKTVTYDALQFAFFLGFSEVYILGMDMTVDHDWGKNGHCYEIQRNPDFPNTAFPETHTPFIQRGLPGHPEYRSLIEELMGLARDHFQKAGRRLVNDHASSLQALEKEDVIKRFGKPPHVTAFVPAKGTSQRVPSKNMRVLGDKPLFLHVLDTLLRCRNIHQVYLDSDSDEIFELAQDRGHHILKRPAHLATNATDGNELLLFEQAAVPPAELYLQVLPTAPFLTAETIDETIYELTRQSDCDSLFTVTRQRIYLWDAENQPLNYNPREIPNSFNLDATTIETMGLYLIRRDTLLKERCRIGINPILFPISTLESFDINTEHEFQMAELIYSGMTQQRFT